MAKVIVRLLSWPGIPIILVFDPKGQYQIAKETPSAGALNTWGGGWEKCDFRLKALFISEAVRDNPWLLWNIRWQINFLDFTF